jgi:hypothetical protein
VLRRPTDEGQQAREEQVADAADERHLGLGAGQA